MASNKPRPAPVPNEGGQAPSDPGKLAYYRDGSRALMRIVNVQAVVILALALGLAFYLGTQRSRDRFFAQMDDGKVLQMAALSSPNMGRDAISNWAASAAGQVMTFGFNDIDERFAESKNNFTQKGWDTFRKAVMNSKFVEEMMSKQQILTTVPENVPVLKKEGFVNGTYSWTFDIPLLITFRAGSVKSTRSKSVQMVIEKVSTRESPAGVGISEWYIY